MFVSYTHASLVTGNLAKLRLPSSRRQASSTLHERHKMIHCIRRARGSFRWEVAPRALIERRGEEHTVSRPLPRTKRGLLVLGQRHLCPEKRRVCFVIAVIIVKHLVRQYAVSSLGSASFLVYPVYRCRPEKGTTKASGLSNRVLLRR